MPTEVLVLALAGLLQAVQYALLAVPANLELGPAGPRDAGGMECLSPRTGRRRAGLVGAMQSRPARHLTNRPKETPWQATTSS